MTATAADTATMTVREALTLALREELQRDERVFLLGEEIGVFEGSTRSRPGYLRSSASSGYATRRSPRRASSVRDRRRDGRRAPGGRGDDRQLHPARDGPGGQERRQDPVHVRRRGRLPARDPHAGRRRQPAHRPALAELRRLVRARPRPEGARPRQPGRRARPAQDRDPRRRPRALPREPAALQGEGRGPRGPGRADADRPRADRPRGHRPHDRRPLLRGRARATSRRAPARAARRRGGRRPALAAPAGLRHGRRIGRQDHARALRRGGLVHLRRHRRDRRPHPGGLLRLARRPPSSASAPPRCRCHTPRTSSRPRCPASRRSPPPPAASSRWDASDGAPAGARGVPAPARRPRGHRRRARAAWRRGPPGCGRRP
jgi:hypothetical protein